MLGPQRDVGQGAGVPGNGEATCQGGHGIQERAHPGLDVDLVGELGVCRTERHSPGVGGGRVGAQGSRQAAMGGTTQGL